MPSSKDSIDCLNEFKTFVNEEYKSVKSPFEILTTELDYLVSVEHHSIKGALRTIKGRKHYGSKDMNLALLEELSAINSSTYTRMKSYDNKNKLGSLVSICIVLCFDLRKSEDFLNAGGFSLKKKSRLNQAYSYVINKNYEEFKMNNQNVDYCYERITIANERLIELKVEDKDLLGTHSKKD